MCTNVHTKDNTNYAKNNWRRTYDTVMHKNLRDDTKHWKNVQGNMTNQESVREKRTLRR